MAGGASMNRGGLKAEENPQDVTLSMKDRYFLEAPAILRELHAQKVTFQVIEGMGHELFIRPIEFRGTLESLTHGYIEEEDLERVPLTTFTLRNIEGRAETFEVPKHLSLPEDKEVTVKGARVVADSTAIDFLGLASENLWQSRLEDLKALLAQSRSVQGYQITAGGAVLFEEDELKELIEEACRKNCSGRDRWAELLADLPADK